MRLQALAITLALTAIAGCSHSDASDASSSTAADSEDAGAPAQAACSLTYWSWVLHTLEPQLARPATEVSEDDLMALVAKHPDPAYTDNGYGICWRPIFDQYFTGNALYALHQADVIYVDQKSPDFKSYDAYLRNITMTPEVRRNGKAILALRPATMKPTDSTIWASTYSSVMAESIRPVGMPGPMEYYDVVEGEWVLSKPEIEYLAVVESARADGSADGVYSEWISNFSKWLFGPPPAVSSSYVFNAAWLPAVVPDSYGLSGIALVNGVPVLPPAVDAFVERMKATAPAAIGSYDTGEWWVFYNGRALRAMSDVSQNQPILNTADGMALDILESVKPASPRGIFAYQSWQSLMTTAASMSGDTWTKRFAPLEPCVDTTDIPTAPMAKVCPSMP